MGLREATRIHVLKAVFVVEYRYLHLQRIEQGGKHGALIRELLLQGDGPALRRHVVKYELMAQSIIGGHYIAAFEHPAIGQPKIVGATARPGPAAGQQAGLKVGRVLKAMLQGHGHIRHRMLKTRVGGKPE